jgi:DNA polymerase I-like protein with 3'-5' exonuclease and polymerase domains
MIFDVEADGLLEQATKIHVLSWEAEDKTIHSTHDYDIMRQVLMSAKELIGHNIVRYDLPLIEKILGISPSAAVTDTLILSWYLEPSHIRHGLDDWGKRLGVMKPKITDWDNLTPEEYAHRCEEDVKINSLLWDKLDRKLSRS